MHSNEMRRAAVETITEIALSLAFVILLPFFAAELMQLLCGALNT
jgi:hypothetical protein